MNEKVLQTLEYYKIIDKLTEKAGSEPGRKMCQNLRPHTDLSGINEAHRNRPPMPFPAFSGKAPLLLAAI